MLKRTTKAKRARYARNYVIRTALFATGHFIGTLMKQSPALGTRRSDDSNEK
jgi:hypothetical protein